MKSFLSILLLALAPISLNAKPGENIQPLDRDYIPESKHCAVHVKPDEDGIRVTVVPGYGKACGEHRRSEPAKLYRREMGTNSFVWEGLSDNQQNNLRCDITYAYPTKFYQTCYVRRDGGWEYSGAVPYIDENVGLQ